jgi:hypothetical protein
MLEEIKYVFSLITNVWYAPRLSQPHFGQVWGWNSHSQSWEFGVLRTPEFLEFDRKGQNTSPWGVLSVIGKVLKCKCPKWLCIGHLDICSPSYGQKKGRESNWQFDSRPLKVGNRPSPYVRWGSATRHWKSLEEGYKFGSNLVLIWGRGEKLRCPKASGVQNRDSFMTPLWESREKVPFGCKCGGEAQRIL